MLFLFGTAAAKPAVFTPQFTIIHLNDIYRIDPVEDGKSGGLGRVATLVQNTKGPVLLLHAGDFLAPSLESQYFRGRQMIAALNFLHRLAPLYVVPGNHEFDEKEPRMLVDALHASHFTWLAANLQLRTPDAEANARITGGTVVTLGKHKIGIFALTLHGGQNGRDRSWAPVDSSYVIIAAREIRALEAQGAAAIIGLTHLNIDTDRRLAGLRRDHPTFMWIAGGHEHSAQSDPLSPQTALITKGDSNARSIWRVQFGLEDGKLAMRPEHVVMGPELVPDKRYGVEIAQRYRTELERLIPFINTRIGFSKTVLQATEEAVRTRESNWGNYLADRMLSAFGSLRADVAVLNGGALRIDDDFSGEIRFEHLWRTFGFATRVGYVWLKGREVRQELLEHSVAAAPGDGRFLQVAGMKFEFDRRQEAGRRVRNVQIARAGVWSDLVEDQVYVVAVPDYLYEGGDGYNFKSKAIMAMPPGPELKLLAFEAITQSFARGDSIAPVIEGRIREIK